MASRKIFNSIVGGALALGVIGIGFAAYQQKAQADTIVPGYATAHLHFNLTVPVVQNIQIKATFTQPNTKKFYFKERDFQMTADGLNTVEWYIRKIPAGEYTLTLTSPQGLLQETSQQVTLENDKVADIGSFDLNLGMPIATPEPIQSIETIPSSPTAASSATVPSSGDSIPFPPVPQLP